MHGHLRLAIPNGLHFFEPRYRRLVQRAMASDGRFVFAVSQPVINSIAYLCELHNVTVYPDGRADVHALPVAECRLLANHFEDISSNHPPLMWCMAESLPLPSAQMIDNIQNVRRFLVRARQAAAAHAAAAAEAEEAMAHAELAGGAGHAAEHGEDDSEDDEDGEEDDGSFHDADGDGSEPTLQA